MSALFDKLRQFTSIRACNIASGSIRRLPAITTPKQPTFSIVHQIEQRRSNSASRNWKNLRRERRHRKHLKVEAAAEAVRAKKAASKNPIVPMPAEMLSKVSKDGKEFRTVTEGKATILIPEGAKVGEDTREVQQVFYNPIQQYNRDLSVLAIKAFGEEQIERRQAARKKGAEGAQGQKRKRVGENKEDSKRACLEDGSAAASKEAEPATTEDVENPVAETAEDQVPVQDAPSETSKPPVPALHILDALSASGLRALRYAHELPFPTQIKANDLSASAAQSIQLNVDHNGVQDKITVTNDDALALMYRAIADGLSNRDHRGYPSRGGKFDVIDLDPYGTAAPFFDAAVQAVKDNGGLLCITCTDSAVWAGHSYAEKTFALYGGLPVKGLHSHEAGLRLILNAVATSAARYGLSIEPQLSLSIDFYTKLFIKVHKSPQAVKFLASKTMVVYNCDHGCGSWETQPLMRSQKSPNKKGDGYFYKYIASQGPTSDRNCKHCGHKMHMTGPMYAGRIHSKKFIERILTQIPEADPAVYGTLPRLEGMLRTALEEIIDEPGAELSTSDPKHTKSDEFAIVDHAPFYVVPAKLAHVLYCQTPPDDMIRGALLRLGYQARRSHCRPGSIKTDAPLATVWRIMTEWVRQKSPISPSRITYLKQTPQRPAFKILSDAGLLSGTAEEAGEGKETKDDTLAQEKEEDKTGKAKDKAESSMAEEEDADQYDRMDFSGFTRDDSNESIVFDEGLAKLGRSKEPRLVRYQSNPEPNWGPLSKARSQ